MTEGRNSLEHRPLCEVKFCFSARDSTEGRGVGRWSAERPGPLRLPA